MVMSCSESDSSSDDETYVPPVEVDQSDEEKNDASDEDKNELKKEEVDKLWESFKSETKSDNSIKEKDAKTKRPTADSTVQITKVYDFAGEEVRVTKEVGKDSKEAKTVSAASPGLAKMKRSGGLQGILGKMNKKPKLSTLEKSKLDWNTFKDEQGISDDLKCYNKGKNGYLEKKMFLERTDNRQFEKERDMRLQKSSKR